MPPNAVAVQFVRVADDDAGRPSTLTHSQAMDALAATNEVWARNGGDVMFYLHPASNFDRIIRSTLLNRDCMLVPGLAAADVAKKTNPDLDGDGKKATRADGNTLCERETHATARNAYGVVRADRIVVFSRGGNDKVEYDAKAGHWTFGQSGGGYTGVGTSFFVVMPASFGGTQLLAHELGHYLHLSHTFSKNPQSIEQAAAQMKAWAASHPGQDPRSVFDGDGLPDTPPDPRGSLFVAVHGTKCDPTKGSVVVEASTGGLALPYVLTPDRDLVMGYYFTCGFDSYVSDAQYDRVHAALGSGNRRSLVIGDHTCYEPDATPRALPTTMTGLQQVLSGLARCKASTDHQAPWDTTTSPPVYRPYRDGSQTRVIAEPARETALLRQLVAPDLVE
jgi:hypothetical protein